MSVPPAKRATRYLVIALRWILIVLVVFAMTDLLSNYVRDHILPQIYTAKATLQVPPGDLIVPTAGSRPEPVAFQPEFENTIRSPDFLLPVIKDLGLQQAWAKRINKSDDQLPDVDALTHMEDVLKFRTEQRTSAIEITASSDVPKESADIANAVADRYKTMRDVEAAIHMNSSGDALREQIAAQQKVVDDKKAALEKMREKLGRYPITIPGALTSPPNPDQAATLKAFRDAQRDIDDQQRILDALNIQLTQGIADGLLVQSPVRILSRAEVPTSPTHPNKHFAFVVTMIAASILSLLVASFVEIVLLFLRASERTDN